MGADEGLDAALAPLRELQEGLDSFREELETERAQREEEARAAAQEAAAAARAEVEAGSSSQAEELREALSAARAEAEAKAVALERAEEGTRELAGNLAQLGESYQTMLEAVRSELESVGTGAEGGLDGAAAAAAAKAEARAAAADETLAISEAEREELQAANVRLATRALQLALMPSSGSTRQRAEVAAAMAADAAGELEASGVDPGPIREALNAERAGDLSPDDVLAREVEAL